MSELAPIGALHVTDVLERAGFTSPFVKRYPESAVRGTIVHAATAIMDTHGDLDWATVDAPYHGFLRAWEQFTLDYKPKWELIEHPVGNDEVCGTLDRLTKDKVLVSIKTGAGKPLRYTALQEAAYGWLYDPRLDFGRLVVQLHSDGTYESKEWPRDEYFADVECFRAAAEFVKRLMAFEGRGKNGRGTRIV